ncbi:MAG: histidinol dehydrogenase [Methanomassiliicoccales archaeon]
MVEKWKALDLGEWNESRRRGLEDVRDRVESIVEGIRRGGDEALLRYTRELDGQEIQDPLVARERIERAYDEVSPQLMRALEEASERIERFHRLQMNEKDWTMEVWPGVHLGMRWTPLRRVGAYIPGGRASYPSTALMCVLPPKVAGVEQVLACTPPPVQPATLVALDMAGADRIYQIGGAQAVAAMVLGTESVVRVDKVVGPGNLYVTAAKVILSGQVEIDFPAGPSEIVVVADQTADPALVASDIMAQCEHDPSAACALVSMDRDLPDLVWEEIEGALPHAARREIIERSLSNCGYLIVEDLDGAMGAANRMAPEHLSIQTRDPESVLEMVRDAGAVFLGSRSAVACGDYGSGTNHVLPTAGNARLRSGLDVFHFLKRCTVQRLEPEGLEGMGDMVETLAGAEGLGEHARSVSLRRR